MTAFVILLHVLSDFNMIVKEANIFMIFWTAHCLIAALRQRDCSCCCKLQS